MKSLLLSIFLVSAIGLVQAQDKPFEQPYIEQDTLYSMTPTDDGEEGFHLWVWKPSFESNMPVKKFDHKEYDMNRDSLKRNPPVLPEMIPEGKMPNPMKKAPEDGSK